MRLINYIILFAALFAAQTISADEKQLAFPGAEGYGKYATGGRGGEVCYVTTLEDCTDSDLKEGTFRWAICHNNGGKPRTILFKVSGTILLTSNLKMKYPDVSILGQSAPNGGICIAGYKLYVCKNNVIIRYIRFRAGDLAGYKGSSVQSLNIENAKNVIVDHCSITWSMEECLGAYDTDSTTVQYSIIGEGLYLSKNVKGARAYATQWGGEHSTMHHCLLTNCNNRVPRFNGVREDASWNASVQKNSHDKFVDSEFANNVMFNWGKSNSAYGGEDDPTVNNDGTDGAHNAYDHIYMINNYWRPGPCTKSNVGSTRYFVQGSASNGGYGQWYLSGNKFELGSKFRGTGTQWTDANLKLVNANNLYGYAAGNANRAFNLDGATANQTNYDKYVLTSMPADGLSGLQYESADDAYAKVVSTAGASLPAYDEVDIRLLAEAAGTTDPKFEGKSGVDSKGNTVSPRGVGIINSPNDITLEGPTVTLTLIGVDASNVYPDLSKTGNDYTTTDTDGDGMPDAYETANGLNANDSSDGAATAQNGYSNLENFLNAIVDGTVKADGTATAIKTVSAKTKHSKLAYNAAGQRILKKKQGLIISDGGKSVVK